MKYLLKGLSDVVPLESLKIFDPSELEVFFFFFLPQIEVEYQSNVTQI